MDELIKNAVDTLVNGLISTFNEPRPIDGRIYTVNLSSAEIALLSGLLTDLRSRLDAQEASGAIVALGHEDTERLARKIADEIDTHYRQRAV